EIETRAAGHPSPVDGLAGIVEGGQVYPAPVGAKARGPDHAGDAGRAHVQLERRRAPAGARRRVGIRVRGPGLDPAPPRVLVRGLPERLHAFVALHELGVEVVVEVEASVTGATQMAQQGHPTGGIVTDVDVGPDSPPGTQRVG